MNFQELGQWIENTFQTRPGEPKAYYEEDDGHGGIRRGIYVVYRHGVEVTPDDDPVKIEHDVTSLLQATLQTLKNRTGEERPVMVVRRPLMVNANEHLGYFDEDHKWHDQGMCTSVSIRCEFPALTPKQHKTDAAREAMLRLNDPLASKD